MKIKEVNADLFEVYEKYQDCCCCHAISSDYALGKGIAREFNFRYDMRNKLNKMYSNYKGSYPNCLLVERTFNLVTKDRYYNKPTYKTIEMSLKLMKEQCLILGVKKLCMPLIGCGLDKLQWDKVKDIIINIFEDTDISIVICRI